MGDYSFFLFARPSFVEGAARILDFGDTLTEYNRSSSEAEADYNALLADWSAVGQDMRDALRASIDERQIKTKQLEASTR